MLHLECTACGSLFEMGTACEICNQQTIIEMNIAPKYKAAHYAVNRFKSLGDIEIWMERQMSILSIDNYFELCIYFKKKCIEDLKLVSQCECDERTQKILNTANFLKYCNDWIQQHLIAKHFNPQNND